jgi:phosphotransferase system  glucose/maltose/N-acetylglucosamine-specific IIC component
MFSASLPDFVSFSKVKPKRSSNWIELEFVGVVVANILLCVLSFLSSLITTDVASEANP